MPVEQPYIVSVSQLAVLTIALGQQIQLANTTRPLNAYGYDNSVMLVDLTLNMDVATSKQFTWDITTVNHN